MSLVADVNLYGREHFQVSIEERLSKGEKKTLADAQKQFDLELAELLEKIDAVQKVCEFRIRISLLDPSESAGRFDYGPVRILSAEIPLVL